MADLDSLIEAYNYNVKSLTKATIEANERFGRMAERLGRIISRFNAIDQEKTGLIPLIGEYHSIVTTVNRLGDHRDKLFDQIVQLMRERNEVDFSKLGSSRIYHEANLRYRAKKELIDDILRGLSERGLDRMGFEEAQRKKVETQIQQTSQVHVRGIVKEESRGETVIEDVFLLYDDGRLISHQTRRLRPDVDEAVICGMLTAVRNFIEESFDPVGGSFRLMDYGSLKILIEHKSRIYIAVVVAGREPTRMRGTMKVALDAVWDKYKDALEKWDGIRIKGIDGIMRLFIREMVSQHSQSK